MGILKHLLGGGHGSRHGYGSHGNRHGQNGSYGDPNLNPQPRRRACLRRLRRRPRRSVLRAMRCIADAGRAQCRATLAPGASFCGQCGARAQARACAGVAAPRMRDAVLMATSTRAQGALDDSQAASSRRQRAGRRRHGGGRLAKPASMQRSGMHMRGHAESHGERDPARAAGPASRVPSNMAASSGSSPRRRRRRTGRRPWPGRWRRVGAPARRGRHSLGGHDDSGAQDRDGIAGSDDEGSDHQKYGLSLRASMQSKTTTKAKVGEASVQIARTATAVRHGPRQRRLAGRRQRRATIPAPKRRARADDRWRPSCRCWVCPRIARRHSVRWLAGGVREPPARPGISRSIPIDVSGHVNPHSFS